MIICQHCGENNSPSNLYCIKCGIKLAIHQVNENLTYKIHSGDNSTITIINFSLEQFKLTLSVRSALLNVVKEVSGLPYRIDTGVYEDIDVHIRFFDSKDADVVNAFYSKPWPGCFSWLFQTQYYKEHKLEEAKVKKIVRIEIKTSHDGPWSLVMKSPFTEEQVTQFIKKIGDDLQLGFARSESISPIESHVIEVFTRQ